MSNKENTVAFLDIYQRGNSENLFKKPKTI